MAPFQNYAVDSYYHWQWIIVSSIPAIFYCAAGTKLT